MIAMTLARIGRSMKNLDIRTLPMYQPSADQLAYPKSEARNPKQTQNIKYYNAKRKSGSSLFETLMFLSFEFVSDFEFRIYFYFAVVAARCWGLTVRPGIA